MRYFIAPGGDQFLTQDGELVEPPDGWEEVGPDEFTARLTRQQQIGEERAAAWIAEEQQKERATAGRARSRKP